ncbi:MAG: formyltransferase family protein [Acidimicrobiales bacterium]
MTALWAPRIALAGDRPTALLVLDFLLGEGVHPSALVLAGPDRASHAEELVERCPFLDAAAIFRGRDFCGPAAASVLGTVDFLVAVHFPYLVPPDILSLPRHGCLNLHPGYLPFGRGWHTVTWAMLDGGPVGATLHFMDEGIDTGDIVHQRRLEVAPGDTADTVYERVRALEVQVFREAWPTLVDGSYTRTKQDPTAGSFHRRADLLRPEIQRLDLDEVTTAGELLRRLRALSIGRDIEEAAYYDVDDRRCRVQVVITEEPVAQE